MSTAWSLTVGGGVSDPRPLVEPSCLDTGFELETGAGIGGPGDASVANAVVGGCSTPTTGTILSDLILTRLFQ